MKQLLKQFIKKTPFYFLLRKLKQEKDLIEWKIKGKPVPPPHAVKQRTLKVYAKKFGLKILIETGTLYGDMLKAMKNNFDSLYSIELSKELYEKAKETFQKEEKIELIYGDSGIELGNLLKTINHPALFWLDGHYSGGITAKGDKDTPIREELNQIFNNQNRKHVIIIDDARLFGVNPAYPSIEELSNYIRSRRPDTDIIIQDDSIRIIPTQ